MKHFVKILSLFLLLSVFAYADEVDNDTTIMNTSENADTIVYLDENTFIEEEELSEEKTPKEKKQVFHGVSAHLDVASTLIGVIIDKSVRTFEASVDVDLLHCLFPIFEIGFTNVNKQSDGVTYRVTAPFYRVGLNYNFLGRKRKKTDEEKPFIGCYPYIGLRYGFSVMRYYLDGVEISSDYWSGSEFPARIMEREQKYVYGGWMEVLGGVRVNMAKGFTMGWTARVALLSHATNHSKTKIWYMPGFGKNNTVNFGFNYTFGYTFNYEKKQKINNDYEYNRTNEQGR